MVEGRRQSCARGKGALLGECLEKDDGEVVDVAGLEDRGLCWPSGGDFADAVAAELDDLACGEDVGWFDVLVDEVAAVQGLERGDETGGDLAGLFSGEGAVAEDFGEVGVGGLQEGVDERGAVEDGLAVFFQSDEVGSV